MGNLNTVIDFEYKIAANDYKLVQKVKDPRLGELFQMKNNKTGHVIFRKEKKLPDLSTYEMQIEEFVQQQPVKHRNLLKVYGFAGADSHELFKNQYKIFVYFELLPDTLRDVISKRKVPLTQRSSNLKKSGNYFAEPELISIMKQLVDVLDYLQGNGISHGDIRPETCFLTKEGLVKLLNRSLMCSETSIFNCVKKGDKTLFISPTMLEAIKRKQEEPIEDKYKADVFSVGLTLLECATLKPSTQIYDWNNCSINLNMLSNRLLELKERYSLEFFKVIREMISLQEEQRPDFIRLKEILSGDEKLGSYQVITDEDAFSKEAPNQMEPKKALHMQQTQPLKLVQQNLMDQDIAALKKRSSSDRNLMLNSAHNISNNNKPQVQPTSTTSIIPKDNKKEYERVGRSTRNAYFNENIDEEDVIASEGTIKINKIYERAVNRSADKFKTVNVIPTEQICQKLKKIPSAHEQLLNNNTIQQQQKVKGSMTERKPSYHPITANVNLLAHNIPSMNSAQTLKPSLSKILSGSSKGSYLDQQSKQTSFIKSKASSINTSLVGLDENTVTNLHVHCGTTEQYTYNDRTDRTAEKSTISIEKLVREAQNKTDKHRMSMREPSPGPQNIVSQPVNPSVTVAPSKPKEVVPVMNRTIDLYNISPKSTPFSKSGSQPSTSFNSFANSKDKRKASTPVSSDTQNTLVKSKMSPSATSINTINLPTSFPHSPQYFTNPRPSNLGEHEDVLRASHQPEIVDLIENMNEINKSLIDSIVKPAFQTKKVSKPNTFVSPRKAYIPGLNLDLRPAKQQQQQQQTTRGSSVDESQLRSRAGQKTDSTPTNTQTGAVFFNNYSSVPTSGVKENKRNLGRNQSVEGHQPVSFQAESNYRSLRDENREPRGVNPRFCRTDRQPENEGARILAKRRAEDADIQDRIEKAIERSRRTYEYARSAFGEPVNLMNYSSQPVLSTSHTCLQSNSFNYGLKPNMR